ncbi:restriction endonuclease [Bremerella sp.]|uniref:restriction endonuclease n=1 Tax=Bremerella sp. TaxID=2795602 RepID=UPI00391A7B94
MSIPDFQSIMLPFLEVLSDGQERSMKEMVSLLADRFGMSESDLAEVLPSGQQTVFSNRVAWAKTHMKKAGLVDNPSRGRVRLSSRGREVLERQPATVNMKFLKQFDGYPEFIAGSAASDASKTKTAEEIEEEDATPLEQLESAYAEWKSAVSDELLERLSEVSPAFFEQVVVRLLQAMGYGGGVDSGEVTSYARDGGIDGVIREDKLGLDVVCIQAKRWQGTVGRPVVQAFVGSMDLIRAKKGVILTTGRFSDDAKTFVDRIEGKRVVLIDGKRLAEFMIEHDVGVTTKTVYRLKEVSGDFFEEGLDQ